MAAEIIINRSLRETRVARLENGQLVELQIERTRDRSIVGNVYMGRVTRVLPGMQAAFVEVGLSRTAFLYVSNIVDPERKRSVEETESDAEGNSEAPDLDEASEAPSSRSISELVREGDLIRVQVVKEPMGTKGARLTGYLSLAGRYLVYLPDSDRVGVSRRIAAQEERDRLKSIVEKIRPAQGGIIIRTVAESASEKQIKDDLEYLIKLWGSIKKSSAKLQQPGLVFEELDLASKVVRDRVTDDVDRVVVDDLTLFKHLQKFIQSFLPRFKKRVELHSGNAALYDHFGIESEIKKATARKVWLKSGGSIVIDENEALTAIDVNTGRFVGRRNLEDTILQTNLEAVREIAYQIRLRNLGGIIVLDFIDMTRKNDQEKVQVALVEELKKDSVRTHVLPMSEFGVIEMTRKRTQESLRQKLTSPCEFCDGQGYTKSLETLAFEMLRAADKEAQVSDPGGSDVAIYCHPKVAEYFADEVRNIVEEFERRSGRRLTIKIDPQFHLEDYEIFTRDS
jgi:ribonuclease G